MSIHALDYWIKTPQGAYVTRWVQQQCDQRVADVFGFNALQIGLLGGNLLAANRIPLQQTLADKGAADCLSDFAHLPIDSQSIDLVVLPFVLDFSSDPHQVLREIERILRPEGQLIVFGFNPWSLWGLRCWAQRIWANLRKQPAHFPWNGHYLSPPRLRDWMKLLSFEAQRPVWGCFLPPCESDKTFHRLKFLDTIGQRLWPFAGGVYQIHAVKRVTGIRLIQPWAKKTHTQGALTASLPRAARKDASDV